MKVISWVTLALLGAALSVANGTPDGHCPINPSKLQKSSTTGEIQPIEKPKNVVTQILQTGNNCYEFFLDEQHKIEAKIVGNTIVYTVDNHFLRDKQYECYKIITMLLLLVRLSRSRQPLNVYYKTIDKTPEKITVGFFLDLLIKQRSKISADDFACITQTGEIYITQAGKTHITQTGEKCVNMALALTFSPFFFRPIDTTNIQQHLHNLTYERAPDVLYTIFLEKVVKAKQEQQKTIECVAKMANLVCEKPKYSAKELEVIIQNVKQSEIMKYLPSEEIEKPTRWSGIMKHLPSEEIVELTRLNIAIYSLRCMELIILRFEFISTDIYQLVIEKLKDMWKWFEIYFPYNTMPVPKGVCTSDGAIKGDYVLTRSEGATRCALEKKKEESKKSEYEVLLDPSLK